MAFSLPEFRPPDFTQRHLAAAPLARFAPAPADGVLPEGFHATSNHPEYFKQGDGWQLVRESRMDAVVVRRDDGELEVVEGRRVRAHDLVALGRSEDGQEGILVYVGGFEPPETSVEKFAFRTRGTRETPFSRSYDDLYELLRHEREHGYIVWVAGPAVAFDKDS